jgi:hypothetical protein
VDDRPPADEDRALSVQLDLYIDSQPIHGRLRTEGGADERFVGWLGFVDALTRLHEVTSKRSGTSIGELPDALAGTRAYGQPDR